MICSLFCRFLQIFAFLVFRVSNRLYSASYLFQSIALRVLPAEKKGQRFTAGLKHNTEPRWIGPTTDLRRSVILVDILCFQWYFISAVTGLLHSDPLYYIKVYFCVIISFRALSNLCFEPVHLFFKMLKMMIFSKNMKI